MIPKEVASYSREDLKAADRVLSKKLKGEISFKSTRPALSYLKKKVKKP